MKKCSLAIFLLALMLLVATTGCFYKSDQTSSKEEAIFIAQTLPDFKRIVLYFSVSSGWSIFFHPYNPLIYETTHSKIEPGLTFVHEIIYETKTGGTKLLLLEDNRPPKIVATIDLK